MSRGSGASAQNNWVFSSRICTPHETSALVFCSLSVNWAVWQEAWWDRRMRTTSLWANVVDFVRGNNLYILEKTGSPQTKVLSGGGNQIGEIAMFWLSTTCSAMADKRCPQLTVDLPWNDVVSESLMKALIINGLWWILLLSPWKQAEQQKTEMK